MCIYKCIIILIILVILYYRMYKKEYFDNVNSNYIWLYWENKENCKKPDYLNLCWKTIQKHCKNHRLHLLNENTIYNYLPNLRKDLLVKCSIPQKADYIRLALLSKYGGIWLDSDVIVFKPLTELFLVLKQYDFIGFGCHFSNCNIKTKGYPNPANWVIGSKKNGLLMSNCLKKADYILTYTPNQLKLDYHCLGRKLLWSEINYLLTHNKQWSYYHFDSKCIERDSQGKKLINQRHLSNENIDVQCKNKYIFMPIYNTAPGFPKWFKNMKEEDILKQNILFSKLISYSLR